MEIKLRIDTGRLEKEEVVSLLQIVAKSEAKKTLVLEDKQPIESPVKISETKPFKHKPDRRLRKENASKNWVAEDVRFALDNRNNLSEKQIARELGRTRDSIVSLFWRIDKGFLLSKPIKKALFKKRRKLWTKTEIQTVIKESKAGNTPERIAKLLGRSINGVKKIIYSYNHPKFQTQVIKEVLAGDV